MAPSLRSTREVVVRATPTGSPVTTKSETTTTSETTTKSETQARDRIIEVANHARDPGDGLHLVVFTHQLDLGGGQLYMFELLRHLLVELDVSCLVVSHTDGVLRAALEDLGAFVHVAGRPPTRSPAEYEAAMLELAEVVARHGCNAALVNTMSAAAGADLALRLGLPAVWAVHESYPLAEFFFAAYGEHVLHPYIRGGTRRRSGRRPSSSSRPRQPADSTSPTVIRGAWSRFRTGFRSATSTTTSRRATALPSEAATASTRTPPSSSASEPTSHARAKERWLLRSLSSPRRSRNRFSCSSATRATPTRCAVRQFVDRLDLGDRIRLLPVVEDTYAWYAIADVFVTVSDVESLPRSVLEVMTFGVPVLGAAAFGVPELVEDGVTGLLCEPRDVGSTISGLHRILNATPAERSGLGAGGRDRVRARYDSSGYARAHRQLLRGLIDEPRALPSELLLR